MYNAAGEKYVKFEYKVFVLSLNSFLEIKITIAYSLQTIAYVYTIVLLILRLHN